MQAGKQTLTYPGTFVMNRHVSTPYMTLLVMLALLAKFAHSCANGVRHSHWCIPAQV